MFSDEKRVKTGKDMCFFFGYVICLKTGDESYLLSLDNFFRVQTNC